MHYFNAFPRTVLDIGLIDGGKETHHSLNVPNIFRTNTEFGKRFDEALAYEYHDIRDGERPDVVSYEIYGSTKYYWTFYVVNDFLRDDPKDAWPLSRISLKEFIETEYDGKVLVTYDDDLSTRFTIGETVRGSKKGATGTVVDLRPELGQVILKDHVGVFGTNETFTGMSSGDFMVTDATVDLAHATYEYRRTSDGTPATHEFFFPEGELDLDLSPITFTEKLIEVNEERSRIRYVRRDRIDRFASDYYALLKHA